MQSDEAAKILGLNTGADSGKVEQAYEKKKAAIEKKREEAPTDAFRKKCENALKQLEEARDLLLAEAYAEEITSSVESGAEEETRPETRSPLTQTKQADLPSARASATRIDENTAGAQVDLAPGSVLAERYEIVERIGAGGMGAVYHARDRTRQEDVALKVLLPSLVSSARARDRFLDEARLSSKLSHPGIVNVYDVQAEGDYVFLSMELLEGQDLRSLLETRRISQQEFEEREARTMGQSLCEALAHAHETTVHQDIKPENVWVTEEGAYKLMDFGIARVMSSAERTKTGMAMGTAYYMAPEQVKGTGQVDARADQYALAVLLYEVLTGEVPAGRIKPLREQRSDLSKGFAAAIDRALEPDPDDRFPDIEAFGDALAGGRAKAPKKPKPRSAPAASGGSRTWLPWAAGVVVLVGIAAIFGGNFFGARSMVMDLLPDPEAEKRALALDGEVTTLTDQLEARKTGFEQSLDDAERRVEGLERDLRNADDADEKSRLETQLEQARAELAQAERVVETSRRAIFESELYTKTMSTLSVAERELGDGNWEAAGKALGDVQSGLSTLLQRAESVPDLVAKRRLALQRKQEWEDVIAGSGLEDSAMADSLREQYEQADTRVAAGDFTRAGQLYGKALDRIGASTRLLEEVRPEAVAENSAWAEAASSAGLENDAVAKEIERTLEQADEQLAAGEFEAAEKSYAQAGALAADARAFANAASQESISAIAGYLQNHPDGAFADAAETEAWKIAEDRGSSAAYETYMAAFPDGARVTEARDAIERIQAQKEAAAERRAADNAAWERAEEQNSIASYRAYLDDFPQGMHASAARQTIDALEAERAAERRREAEAERRAADDSAWQQAREKGTIPAFEAYLEEYPDGRHADQARQRQENLRRYLPDMVKIPAGTFRMEGLSGDSTHTVHVESFRMMVHELTFDQWSQCVAEGGCSHRPDDEGWGRGQHPVINVSWNAVTQQYIPWLNEVTGGGFRLPSAAEWEYAARAGTSEESTWTNDWEDERTVPVKSSTPNAYGLYDMRANVVEWVKDCWSDPQQVPSDGSAWTSGNCGKRVLRGVPQGLEPDFTRPTILNWKQASKGADYIGFRLVRDK